MVRTWRSKVTPDQPSPPDRGRLQPGIALAAGEQPAWSFRLLLLNRTTEATAQSLSRAIEEVTTMLARLAAGHVRELAGQPQPAAERTAEQFEGLEHLIGFGRRLFDGSLHGGPVIAAPRPDYLSYLPDDGPFPSLRWDDRRRSVPSGEADLVIQLTAPRPSAVNCAAVEVWKLLEEEHLPLVAAGTYDGFARYDGRGWLEFHDGVSNMHSSQRRVALEAAADPAWMAGGTYMAFLRLAVDLAAWRGLSRDEQEMLVGRDKLTGAALVATDAAADGGVRPVASAPLDDPPRGRGLADFLDPPQTTDSLLEASHVHRANQLRGSPSASSALRIFRQGYEFLDDINGVPTLGLNFVSFQRDLSIVHHILNLHGWLGDVNFGGRSESDGGASPVQLITVLAGGLYAVPPVSAPFAGHEVFSSGLR